MRIGLSFPTEHGLVAIWSATVIFTLTMGLIDNFSLVGIIITLTFSLVIIFSYESIKLMAVSKFTEIEVIPLGLVVFSSLLILMWNLTIYSFIFYVILGIFALVWFIFSFGKSRQSYIEIILGAFTLTLIFPVNYNLMNQIDNLEHFLYILAIWWIFSGVVSVIIINVGCYRGKMRHSLPLVIWFFYLITFIPMFLLNYLEPIGALLMVEPTYRAVMQARTQQTIRSRKINIKKIGWQMVFSIFLFVTIILIFAIFDISFANIRSN